MANLGITVLPEWAQAEGIDAVLDRVEAAGATDIATSPYVMAPAESGGSREPPADGGHGSVRVLDRPLFGKRQLMIRTAPSYAPDKAIYAGLAYQPPEPDALTAAEGDTVARFIAAAKARGLKVWFQVQAAIPPGYRVQFSGVRAEDEALGPDGEPIHGRVDANASLAAPDILAYTEALLKDLAAAYPDVAGFRIDWPEYPPYTFGSLFFDFSPHALAAADRLGIDTARMRADALALRTRLTTLEAGDIPATVPSLDALSRYPGVADLLALRRHLSAALVARMRSALPPEMALVPQAFPPPLNALSGFDIEAIAPEVEGIGIKFYTMHWPMILADFARAMGGHDALAPLLAQLLGTGGARPQTVADLRYPDPEEAHAVGADAIAEKLSAARTAAGDTPVYAFTHAYGPLSDVMRRAEAAWTASEGRLWVNRYGYMSDEKLAAFGKMVRG
ncbi:hypothetical protein RDV64_04575 [Acuticoccus sp. MNP-M23]|uniref:hypothetical protein n=1 Tax=Acuticoccus sp. MNP-M23 TaxID=3072793 RepID=UPI00281664BA|nr:hypothetical protein [Acuticoccus sp. MNP-M23]WMS43680.1 hypothetical protein RDV64_04575 [Acuticoccus sp. MNP-M23]